MRISTITLAIALLASNIGVKGQDTLSLEYLLQKVAINNPTAKLSASYDSLSGLERRNIKNAYLPKMDVNAEASWQSDVTSIHVPIPGIVIPTPDKDNYKVSLDVSQLIWDGGITSSQLRVEDASLAIDRVKVESEIHSLQDKVIDLYFGILLVNLADEQIAIMQHDLEARIRELQVGVDNGTFLESDLLSLKAQLLKIKQSIVSNISTKRSLAYQIYSLSEVAISDSARLEVPFYTIPIAYNCVRPDYQMFDLQNKYLENLKTLSTKKRYPKLAAYGRVGYGKPGLNMLSSSFNDFEVIGAKLSWNIWDWNTTSRERQQVKVQQSMNDIRKQAFIDNYNAQVKSSLERIGMLKEQISTDKQMVDLLQKSVSASNSKLKNGTITSSVFLTDFNSLLNAKIDLQIHTVKLSQEIFKLHHFIGEHQF